MQIDLPDAMVKRIRELVLADWLELDDSLQQDLAKVTQDLISRGLFTSTVQISNSKEACNRNLKARCEIAVQSMRRILSAHSLQSTATMSSSLLSLFREIYSVGLAKVADAFEKAIPDQNRASFGKYVEIRYDGIRLDKYLIEIARISDQLLPPTNSLACEESRTALVTWQEKLDYLRQQEAIASDPAQKFTIKKQIEEAEQKIRELD